MILKLDAYIGQRSLPLRMIRGEEEEGFEQFEGGLMIGIHDVDNDNKKV